MTEIPLKKDCFVTSLALMGVRHLGPESLDWEPEILRDAFEEAFGIQKLPQKSFDKLNCGYTLISTDAFTSTIEGFLSATCVMNNLVFDEDEAPYCTFEMCAWSIWEYMNLMGEMEDSKPTEKFNSDIIEYIQQVAKVNGISKFPIWMQFAEKADALPDMTGDIDVFEMYQQRQSDYVNDLYGFVNKKQADLTAELTELQKDGILG